MKPKRIKLPSAILLLTMIFINLVCAAKVRGEQNQVRVKLQPKHGRYILICKDQGWRFVGQLPSVCKNVDQSQGIDSIGAYRQLNFEWQDHELPVSGTIRLYDKNPLVLFSDTSDTVRHAPLPPFPDFTKLPHQLYVFSYQNHRFAPPSFHANDCCTPWLLFNDSDDAMVISPASHFMVASMFGDGHKRVASGLNTNLRDLPKGFSQQTILVLGKGINRTWDLWGQVLNALRHAQRPDDETDILLKYLGYWTDNGATYYYNYDPSLGYAGTLQALVKDYQQKHIPIRYLQLDSWWYEKTFTSPDGRIGRTRSPQFPAGEWNRSGGLLKYEADPFLFPDGLAAFQKAIGLPLVTHNRWIDPASPYHNKYHICGYAAVDPKWWEHITDYLGSSGVATYEQDWLNHIYRSSPKFNSTFDIADEFLNDMASACGMRGITMQYCMALPCYFLQGSTYKNLTTIRVSDDRFCPDRWNDFLYTSRLADSLGIWPWSDVFMSSETNNLLLATLSAGPVGIGDAIGKENKANLLKAVRADGVIVKPDTPIVPMDQSYFADVHDSGAPLIASTYTDHAGFLTYYVFAFNRNQAVAKTVQFSPTELGLSGPVYVYDFFTKTAVRVGAGGVFKAMLPPKGAQFYVVAPIGRSGIAFLGDSNQFVSTGKQRISTLIDEPGELTATVTLAATEKTVELHGYAGKCPTILISNGTSGPIKYNSATKHFMVKVFANQSSPLAKPDMIRHITVHFQL